MGTKHDPLTEEHMRTAAIDSALIRQINLFMSGRPGMKPADVNILDWGCGRGRTVAALLEMGFNAFGADVDDRILKNGYPLFESRGFNPSEILLHLSRIQTFPDMFFHIIFSEQVVEHVADLKWFVQEQQRLTAPGGMGLHTFPGSCWVVEPHVKMPFVHWLPKNESRKIMIALMRLAGFGPDAVSWPEAKGKSFWQICDIFFRYLNEKTYYRDIRTVQKEYEAQGFAVTVRHSKPPENRNSSSFLIRNGFMKSQIQLSAYRPA
jgi:SAM-dependent methyltransferase